MAQSSLIWENDVKLLINSLADFEDDEDNFDISLKYAMSNFKYHKFLDPDSHKIKRALKGMSEKFSIHCFDKKADAFDSLVEEFLSQPLHNGDDSKETHYSILSFLLLLADSPTKNDFERQKQVQEEVPVDDFDWTGHLMEGVQVYNPYNEPDSPEWSDSDSETEDRPKHISFSKHAAYSALTPRVEVTVAPDLYATSLDDSVLDTGESWLERNLVVRYWKGEGHQVNSHTVNRSSTLNACWEGHLSDSSVIYEPPEKVVVTEFQVVREVLWMLCGSNDLYIYVWDKDLQVFHLQPFVHVTHLTQVTHSNLANELGTYGGMVRTLYGFVESVIADSGRSHAGQHCQTYQAFAAALSAFLQEFTRKITDVETTVRKEGTPDTLSSLLSCLQPHLEPVRLLHQLYMAGVGAYSGSSAVSPCQRAACLLAEMYNTLLRCDTMEEQQQTMVSVLLPIWLASCRPYLGIIDTWMSHGGLHDPGKEFIVQRDDSVKALDETFWSRAFRLECSGDSDTEKVDTLGEEVVNPPSRAPVAPGFLVPVLQEVILAGKSMEMLHSLGRLKEAIIDSKEVSLYSEFVKGLATELTAGSTKCQDEKWETEDNEDASAHSKQLLWAQIRTMGMRDPLLQENFDNIFPIQSVPKTDEEADENIIRSFSNLKLGGMKPLKLSITRCLLPPILTRYQHVCSTLLRIIKDEYKLMENLAAVRQFYLMESGDTMFDFYTDIFDKLRLHEPWQGVSFLNLSLQEALSAHFPHCTNKLFVSVEEVPAKEDRQPIHALEGLTMHYKVDWPLDVILSSHSFSIYNKVFAFLLQIKRAKYCLDELRFRDLDKEDELYTPSLEESILVTPEIEEARKNAYIHGMQLFRMKLLHFVNSLHNYIMTRILHSTGLEFQRALDAAADLDQVLLVHDEYLDRVYQRCLLHKDVAFVKHVAEKVLNLCIAFQQRWDDGRNQRSLKVLSDMEYEYGRCLQFLSSFLNKYIKRGSFPHLESLAFSLSSST